MKSRVWRVVLVAMLAVATGSPIAGQPVTGQAPPKQPAAKPAEEVETVAVGGCLKENPAGTWALVSASEPVASAANAPSPKELAELPKSGKREFRLIGVGIFDLPAHKDHSMLVKGLLVKGTPVSRINVTSVTMVADTCPPKP